MEGHEEEGLGATCQQAPSSFPMSPSFHLGGQPPDNIDPLHQWQQFKKHNLCLVFGPALWQVAIFHRWFQLQIHDIWNSCMTVVVTHT